MEGQGLVENGPNSDQEPLERKWVGEGRQITLGERRDKVGGGREPQAGPLSLEPL